MDNFRLIHPSHLNHYGFLFGGHLLQWVDEYAYIAAVNDFPSERFVTVAMNKVVFKKGVRPGDILRFRSLLQRRGTSSVRYAVTVSRITRDQAEDASSHEPIFATEITYVCVDAQGQKKSLPPPTS